MILTYAVLARSGKLGVIVLGQSGPLVKCSSELIATGHALTIMMYVVNLIGSLQTIDLRKSFSHQRRLWILMEARFVGTG